MTPNPAEPGLVLVADDDEHIVELVSMYLQRAGYRVAAARDGDETLRRIAELRPDLIVLDIMMPGPDGLQVCRSLRRRSNVPILLLTARSSDIDKIAGLRFGADDYVTKPFNPDELVARIEAVLRRSRASAPQALQDTIHLNGLDVDLARRAAAVDGRAVSLTPKEFDLLATFARFPNIVLDREQILDLVWGTAFYALRTVDVHVARLREKLKGGSLRIETIWGTGYRLAVE
ncbi:MAG: response regulator transcription factor, partial [Dehalococcoidia bacterium]|nr:response regulator transcription factor [Dehalococcoidia bacterium]